MKTKLTDSFFAPLALGLGAMRRAAMLLLVMMLTATTAWAQWSGEGTEANPYQIKTAEDLNTLATNVNNGTKTYSGKYFRLEANLDYGGGSATTTNYTPIGNYNRTFRGNFDGNKKTISGVRVYRSGNTNGDSYVGIFGNCANGNIHDLTVSDAIFTGHDYVGGIVGCIGSNSSSTVDRCTVTSSVYIYAPDQNQNYYHGGIVGYIYDSTGTVSNCVSSATLRKGATSGVQDHLFYGGIVGRNYGIVSGCLADGADVPTITGSSEGGNSYGAICGSSNGTVSGNCYHACKVDGNIIATSIGVQKADTDGATPVYAVSTTSGISLSPAALITYNGAHYYTTGTVVTLSSTAPTGQHLTTYKAGDTNLPGNTYTVTNSDVSFSRVLEYNTYSVQFNGNGYTGGSMSNQGFTYGTAQNLNANGFSRTGYTFAGWSKTADGPVDYADKASVINLTATNGGTVTLYAKWTANTYSVQFDANGGTGDAMSNQGFTYDAEPQGLTANGYSRTGYTFAGWATSADGDVDYADEASVSNLTADPNGTVTLYAKWNTITYTITYNLDGGSVATPNPVTYNVETETFQLNNPTKPGYTFIGWTGTNGNTPQMEVTITKGSTEDRTYNANYEFARITVGSLTYECTSGTEAKVIVCNNSAASVTIPATVSNNDGTYNVTAIEATAFSGCTSLLAVILDSATPPTLGSGAFDGCTVFNTIYVPESSAETYKAADGWSAYSDKILGYDGTCGDNVCYSYDSSTKTLDIFGTGAMADYNNVMKLAPWANYASMIHSVVIENGVTSIGNSAFQNYAGLTSVEISASVTSIGYSAFQNCAGLTSVEIPASVTSIDNNAFDGCTGLTDVIISANVTSIGIGAFKGCHSLTNVTIPASVTSIGEYAFEGCSGLETISVADGNAVYDSRNNCNAIIEKATNTLLYGCKNTVIPDGVTSIGYEAFNGCTGLTSIDIPASVTSISYEAFRGCTGLQTVFTSATTPMELGSDAFYDCNALGAIIVPVGRAETYKAAAGWSPYADKIYAIDGTCGDNISYSYLTDSHTLHIFGTGDMSDYEGSNIPWYSYRTDIAKVVIAGGVTSIGANAFKGCSSLNTVVMKNATPLTLGNNAFDDCTELHTIYVPTAAEEAYMDAAGWSAYADKIQGYDGFCGTDVYYVFDSSTKTLRIFGTGDMGDNYRPWSSYGADITSVTIENGVTSIGRNAFSGCTGLTDVTIPASVTSIGDNAFLGCTGLTDVIIPANVTSIGYGAFSGCTSLTSIEIPASVTSIGNKAFFGCTSLTSVTIYAPALTDYGYGAFDNNASGRKIYVPSNSVDAYKAGWSQYADDIVGFDACGSNVYYAYDSSTKTLNILGTGNMADYDGTNMPWYSYRTDIAKVVIAGGVTGIGANAFKGCSSLKAVVMKNVTPLTLAAGAFDNCTELHTIYVPTAAAEGYKAVDGWSAYTDKIQGYDGICGDNVYYAYDSSTKTLRIFGTGDMGDNYRPWSSYGADITSVTIGNGVTRIGEYAFRDCSGLETISVAAGNTVYDSRNNCNAIIEKATNTLLYGCKNTIIPDNVTSIHYIAFYNCTGLTSIDIPASVTSIYDGAFRGCTGLESITIPASVTSIGGDAFLGCRNLTSITIPASVTSIGSNTFDGCSSLTSIEIPASVTSIGDYAFAHCTGLKDVTIYAPSLEYYGYGAFEDNASGRKIFVPSNNVDAYKTNWNRYYNDILPIEGIALADNANNNGRIAAAEGITLDVTLQGRTLYKDGDWNTICLPFGIDDFEGTIFEGATVMELDKDGTYDTDKQTGYDSESGTLSLYFKNATSIVAGVPYLVKWESAANITNPVFTGVTVSNVSNNATSTDGKVQFRGNYSPVELTGGDASNLYLGTNNKLYWPSKNRIMNAFRGYFHVELEDGQSQVRAFNLNFDGETATGVSLIDNGQLTIDNYAGADEWYTLDGRKLDGKPSQKGIYIHYGKKVVVN